MNKIILKEEVKPHPEPKERRIYNSPTSFGGRYLYLSGASEEDIAYLKREGLGSFWDSEYLEDIDLTFEQEGFRLGTEGIEYLKSREYEIIIKTLEDEQRARELLKQNEKEKREQQEQDYKDEIARIESTFRGLTFHEQGDIEKFKDLDYLEGGRPEERMSKTIIVSNQAHYDSYREYGLTSDRRVFVLYKDPWVKKLCSNEPATKEYLELVML